MSNVVVFKHPETIRKACKFINKPTGYVTEDGVVSSFPCIVVYDMGSKVPVLYTRLEDYVVKVLESDLKAEGTVNKRANNVCAFLNHLLWNEQQVNGIEDVDLAVVRRFMTAYKTKENGSPRRQNTWAVCCKDVIQFLVSYYKRNKEYLNFKYCESDLINRMIIRDTGEVFPSIVAGAEKYGVSRQSLSMCLRGKTKTCAKCRWMKLSEFSEEKRNVLISVKDRRTKSVKNLDTGEIFISTSEAAIHYHISKSAIANCARGVIPTAAGCRWTYL